MTTEIEDRIERALSQEMSLTLVDTDPVVIEVLNEESNRIHSVTVDSLHCSCEDHVYRGYICKHLIRILLQGGQVGSVTEKALKERRTELYDEANEIRDRLDDVLFQIEQIGTVFNELGISHAREETDEAALDMLDDAVEPDEDSDADTFTEVVEDLVGDSE